MLRRNGTTLMEVLIAIFVMGIGLLAVLSLFPVGAILMARAIKDDRAAHAVANARAIAIAANLRFDPFVTAAMDNPPPPILNSLDGPSIAVYVDPIGSLSYSAGSGDKLRIAGGTGIARCSPSFVLQGSNLGQAATKWCTLLDDITFGADSTPSRAAGAAVQRGGEVSWAWMLRRPKASVPACCELTVVIYNQRPLAIGNIFSGKEVAYQPCAIGVQPNLVTLTWLPGKPAPRLSAGDWVLDVTPHSDSTKPGNAKFYRVNSVGDIVDGQLGRTLEITLDQALRLPPGAPASTPAMIVVMEGVVEVLECGTGWSTGGN